MATRFTPGTPTPGPLHYTAEQEKAIEQNRVADKRGLWFAAPKCANCALTPAGEIVPITTELAKEIASAGMSRHGAWKADEVAEHLKQGRFMFVVNEDAYAQIYFQCATTNNPEYEGPPNPPKAEE